MKDAGAPAAAAAAPATRGGPAGSCRLDWPTRRSATIVVDGSGRTLYGFTKDADGTLDLRRRLRQRLAAGDRRRRAVAVEGLDQALFPPSTGPTAPSS